MKIDLHMHSIYSDGTYCVEDLVKRAHEKGLTHIALTDHDSVNGIEEAIKFCKQYNITLIKGIELSTRNQNESVHILGYFLNEIGDEILKYSEEQFILRKQRAKKMCELLKSEYNLNIDYNDIKDEKGMITRGNLARLLMSKNNITEDECRFYLSNKSKAYVDAAKLSTKQGIELLKNSNAITILAHPTLLRKNDPIDIINLGVDGLEGILPLRMKAHSENALTIAEFLNGHEKVAWVKYPYLSGDSQEEKAKKYLPNGASGVLSFGLKEGKEGAEKFMSACSIASIATHVADAKTCMLHPASTTHRQLTEEELTEAGIPPEMIRLSVGIEDVRDLIADFKRALEN